MPEMYVTSPEVKRTVYDYAFGFVTGTIPITYIPSLGDTFEETPSEYRFNLTAKESPMNPEQFIPKQELTIFKSQLLSKECTIREVIEQSPEQKAAWKKVIQELSRTVQ